MTRPAPILASRFAKRPLCGRHWSLVLSIVFIALAVLVFWAAATGPAWPDQSQMAQPAKAKATFKPALRTGPL